MKNICKNKRKIYNFVVIIMDLILINLGFYIAFMMRFDFNPPQHNIGPYVEIIPFITIAALLYFDLYGLLSVFKKSLYESIYSIFFAIGLLSITTIAITYFNQGFAFPRSILIVAPAIQLSLLIPWRNFVWKAKKYVMDTRKVVVIGNNEEEIRNIIDKIKEPASNMLLDVKYMCDTTDLNKAIRSIDMVDEVFVSSSVSSEDKAQIIAHCIDKDKGLYLIPDLSEILLYKSQMLQFDDIPTFAVEKLKLTTGQRLMKRVFDVAISLIGLIILLPVIAVVAMIIRFTSKGPVLYSQERITRENKVFKLYKFRTMVEGAEAQSGPVMSIEGDDRITSVGNALRRSRLDEIPQLFNVLVGHMSIVGPRPERPHFVEQFSKEIPGYHYRISVKAGITGLAQVLGKYTTLPEDKLRYDLLYIKNYSILFDIKLIFQTLKVVLMARSADGFKKLVKNDENTPASNVLSN